MVPDFLHCDIYQNVAAHMGQIKQHDAKLNYLNYF